MSANDTAANFLARLEEVIVSRLEAPVENSYTSKLAGAGTRRIAQKVGEEGVEAALAAAAGSRDELIGEAADLVYHLLVLLADRGIAFDDVVAELERRHHDG